MISVAKLKRTGTSKMQIPKMSILNVD